MTKQNIKIKDKPDFQKMEEYFDNMYNFRYNSVYGVIEYKNKGEKGDYKRLDDYTTNSILREMKWKGIYVSSSEMLSTLQSAYTPIYDPFQAYFDSLPEWDGVDYIQQLADTITIKNLFNEFQGLDKEQQQAHINKSKESYNKFWKTALHLWLTGTVACALDAEKANHLVLVLIGEQGVGKTTWMNKLVPNALKTYFFSGVIDPSNKDTLAHLSECFLINLDELENLNRSELGSLKSMITQQHIRVRKPYGRLAENLIRRASFMGSVNNTEFLRDDTGNRRFLCFEALSIQIEHNINMDMVYSQAYASYKNNNRYWFEGEENKVLSEINQRYKVQYPELEIINKYFITCPDEEEPVLMSVSQLQNFLLENKEVMHNLDLRKLGIALKASKFQRTKKDGIWYYKFKSLT